MVRLSVLLALLLLIGADARAQSARPAWDRLPDGRVVIEIYGRRLAFAPDLPPNTVVFSHRERDASLQEVVANRADAEAWWGPAHPTNPVGIVLSPRLVWRELFDGPQALERGSVRPSERFWIWVYREHDWTDCRRSQFSGARRQCDHFVERSRDVAAIGPGGFIVDRPTFLRGTSQTYYVFPESDQRVAPGDPAYIACQPLWGNTWCENGSLRWGYFLRPGIFLRYGYATQQPNPHQMRRIDDAYRAAAEAFLLDP